MSGEKATSKLSSSLTGAEVGLGILLEDTGVGAVDTVSVTGAVGVTGTSNDDGESEGWTVEGTEVGNSVSGCVKDTSDITAVSAISETVLKAASTVMFVSVERFNSFIKTDRNVLLFAAVKLSAEWSSDANDRITEIDLFTEEL